MDAFDRINETTYMLTRHAKPPISIKPTTVAISMYLHTSKVHALMPLLVAFQQCSPEIFELHVVLCSQTQFVQRTNCALLGR